MFIVVYFAVRLAITPLLKTKDTPKEVDEQHKKLIQLRDLGIIDNDELEKLIEAYDKEKGKTENKMLYEQNKQVLSELKIAGHLNEEEYSNKIKTLKDILGVD
ncbi:MAG: hypothetical protein WAQ88_00085 [Caldicoprobacterales bacterium]